jgi:hypothetical protein
MTIQSYTPAAYQPTSRSLSWASPRVRRWIVAAVGCAVMALSGTGLAGYLDLSSATAADASPTDAPPAN